LQRSRNLAITKLTREQEKQKLWEEAQPKYDEYQLIHSPQEYVQPDLDKLPLSPEHDILGFIATYSPMLSEWERDCLNIVDQESKYFVPQIETKIMNEGWASYWHHRILTELEMPEGFKLEFMVRHNQVLRPTPGGINPYHLGYVIWHDIERRWNEGNTGAQFSGKEDPTDISGLEENNTPGRQKIFEVRKSDRDVSFLRRFLTREIMQELDLFRHEKRGKERVITKVSDDQSWEDVKRTLVSNVGMGSIPVIYIENADTDGNRTLALRHEHDGRDLLLEYAEKTLRHIQRLWGRDVTLTTEVNGRDSLLRFSDGAFEIQKL
jgi:stage V sporulation protein R